MRVLLLLLVLLLSGCTLIEACQVSPGACAGGDIEYIRVNGETYIVERNVL